MLVIYQDTREFLSVRTSRLNECVGLFFCGIGLLSLSIPLLTLDKSIELRIPSQLVWTILQYGLTFGLAGVFIVFQQRKFLFYIPESKLIRWEGLRVTKVIPFADISTIEILHSGSENGLLNLLLNDQSRVLMTRGPRPELFSLATRISQVTGKPVATSRAG